MDPTARSQSRAKNRPPARRGQLASVLLVDDHPMWRDTIRRVLDHGEVARVVAEAADGDEAVRLARSHSPDIVMMDVDLPILDGHRATRRILEECAGTRVLILSALDEPEEVVAAARAGASGYLLKTASPTEVTDALTRLHRGELVFPAAVAEALRAELRHPGAARDARRLRVLVADPVAISREGLARLLRDRGVDALETAGDLTELLRLLASTPVDVVILDPEITAPGGVSEAVRMVRDALPRVGILVLAKAVDHAVAAAILSQPTGGAGYLLKQRMTAVGDLEEAVRRVADGDSVLDPEAAATLVRGPREHSPLDELTDRELAVLELMGEGRSNQAIAGRLFMSSRSVEAHVSNIFMRLGLQPAPDDHRRVLAVITYLRDRAGDPATPT